MKPISKIAWNRVHEKACDVVNATWFDDDPMYDIYREQMLEILDELEAEFGTQSRILDTRGDYVDDPDEKRRLYAKALELAREQNDTDEIEICQQSLLDLDESLLIEAKHNGKKHQKNEPRDARGDGFHS